MSEKEVQSLPLKDKIKNRVMQGDVTLEDLVGLTEKSRRHNVISDIRSLIDGKQDNGDWCPFMSAYIVPSTGEKSRGFPLDREIWYTCTGGYEHPADIRRLAERMQMAGIEKLSGTDDASVARKARLIEDARTAHQEFVRLYIIRGTITVKRREELAMEETKRQAEKEYRKTKLVLEDEIMQSMVLTPADPTKEQREKSINEEAEKSYWKYLESYPTYLKPTKEQLEKDAEDLAIRLEAGIPEIAEKIAYCLTYKENGMYPYFDRALIFRFA